MINSKSQSHNILITNITNGFTLIELLVVIAIIGILATIGIASFTSIQANARNTQRSSRVTILSEALEKYYDANGEYPTCTALTASPGTVTTTTLKGVDPNILTSPTAASGTNSISCATPTADTYGYRGGVNSYTLMYQGEGDASPTSVNSRRQVASAMYTLTLVAGTGGNVSGGGSYASGATPTITAAPSANYSFSSWTGSTGCSGVASHNVTITADMTCTANFTAKSIAMPAVPTVTPSTAGATTTYSWGAASCPGNSARYQYRYTISPSGYDSGLIATASTSVAFATSTEGQTYTVAAQAECYNGVTASGMSASGSGSYYRPVTTIWGCTDPAANNYNPSATNNNGSCTYNYTLTLNYTGSGSVSGGGTYSSGSQVTITATPSTYYSFSSWSCGGAQSQVITVNSNMSCTANFTATSIAMPSVPTVTANTAGATTTFSWGAASCPGNSARYQYRYTISPSGYDSGIVATASTSVAFTTSTVGQTYTVAVQAECYNAVTSSGLTGAGSASYQSVDWTNWYPGIAATAMAGKHVYKTDLGTTYMYSYNTYTQTSDVVSSPQGATGLDPNHPSNMSLVSPQTNPSVDFSDYPAQNACKAIGGRLPNMQELLALLAIAGRASYGNNFQTGVNATYWSSTEYDSGSAYQAYIYSGSPYSATNQKPNFFYVRCVSG